MSVWELSSSRRAVNSSLVLSWKQRNFFFLGKVTAQSHNLEKHSVGIETNESPSHRCRKRCALSLVRQTKLDASSGSQSRDKSSAFSLSLPELFFFTLSPEWRSGDSIERYIKQLCSLCKNKALCFDFDHDFSMRFQILPRKELAASSRAICPRNFTKYFSNVRKYMKEKLLHICAVRVYWAVIDKLQLFSCRFVLTIGAALKRIHVNSSTHANCKSQQRCDVKVRVAGRCWDWEAQQVQMRLRCWAEAQC